MVRARTPPAEIVDRLHDISYQNYEDDGDDDDEDEDDNKHDIDGDDGIEKGKIRNSKLRGDIGFNAFKQQGKLNKYHHKGKDMNIKLTNDDIHTSHSDSDSPDDIFQEVYTHHHSPKIKNLDKTHYTNTSDVQNNVSHLNIQKKDASGDESNFSPSITTSPSNSSPVSKDRQPRSLPNTKFSSNRKNRLSFFKELKTKNRKPVSTNNKYSSYNDDNDDSGYYPSHSNSQKRKNRNSSSNTNSNGGGTTNNCTNGSFNPDNHQNNQTIHDKADDQAVSPSTPTINLSETRETRQQLRTHDPRFRANKELIQMYPWEAILKDAETNPSLQQTKDILMLDSRQNPEAFRNCTLVRHNPGNANGHSDISTTVGISNTLNPAIRVDQQTKGDGSSSSRRQNIIIPKIEVFENSSDEEDVEIEKRRESIHLVENKSVRSTSWLHIPFLSRAMSPKESSPVKDFTASPTDAKGRSSDAESDILEDPLLDSVYLKCHNRLYVTERRFRNREKERMRFDLIRMEEQKEHLQSADWQTFLSRLIFCSQTVPINTTLNLEAVRSRAIADLEHMLGKYNEWLEYERDLARKPSQRKQPFGGKTAPSLSTLRKASVSSVVSAVKVGKKRSQSLVDSPSLLSPDIKRRKSAGNKGVFNFEFINDAATTVSKLKFKLKELRRPDGIEKDRASDLSQKKLQPLKFDQVFGKSNNKSKKRRYSDFYSTSEDEAQVYEKEVSAMQESTEFSNNTSTDPKSSLLKESISVDERRAWGHAIPKAARLQRYYRIPLHMKRELQGNR